MFRSLFLGLFAFSIIVSFHRVSRAEVLFEAYSKILSGGVHVGFVVQRYTFDKKKKRFTSTYYMRTNALGGNITESLEATASEKLEPIDYHYVQLMGGKTKVVKAEVSEGQMKLTKSIDGKSHNQQIQLPPKSFFGTFLNYVILKSPKGLKTGIKYNYKAVAEEDGSVADGMAFIKSERDYNGIPVYRIINDFKGSKYIFFVSGEGETLATKSPINSVATEVVKSPTEATKGFVLDTASLKKVFGTIPTGKKNALARMQKKNKAKK